MIYADELLMQGHSDAGVGVWEGGGLTPQLF